MVDSTKSTKNLCRVLDWCVVQKHFKLISLHWFMIALSCNRCMTKCQRICNNTVHYLPKQKQTWSTTGRWPSPMTCQAGTGRSTSLTQEWVCAKGVTVTGTSANRATVTGMPCRRRPFHPLLLLPPTQVIAQW
jgi:hypothetical protein